MLLLLLASTALAGWTQPAGGHYVKVGARGVVGQNAFMADGANSGTLEDGPETALAQDWALQFYGEYGLNDAWTLVARGAPLGWARYDQTSTLYSGVLAVGARRALLTGRHRLSLQADASYTPPLGEQDLTGGSLLPDLVFSPVESTAALGAELKYGLGFGKNWLVASAGATWLSAEQLDPVAMGMVQLGRTTDRGNRWDLHLPFRVPMGEVEAPANFAGAGQTRYLGLGLGYCYTFGQGWGVSTSFESVLVAAANLAAPTIPLFVEHQGTRDTSPPADATTEPSSPADESP